MEFGRVTPAILDRIDVSLPIEPANNALILPGKPAASPKIYVGCAKWGRPDWVGKIYPKGTKAGDFLQHYAKLFNSIELNATFYRMPTEAQILGWKSKVGKDFKFCPKFTDSITHIKRLKDCTALVDAFLRAITCFDNNLGPIFLMPHPQMSPKQWMVIAAFIDALPKDLSVFLELRHPQFFQQGLDPQVLDFAQSRGIGLVITDAAGRRDCVHMHLSNPKSFIRFVGNSLHASDYTRVDAWVERMKQWLDNGMDELYFFMHQHEELYSPELAAYLVKQMNAVCGLALQVPKFVEEQPMQKGLFD